MSITTATPTRSELIRDRQMIDLDQLKPGDVLVVRHPNMGIQLALFCKSHEFVDVLHHTAHSSRPDRLGIHISSFRAVRHNPVIEGHPDGLERTIDPGGPCSYLDNVALWGNGQTEVLLNGVVIWKDGWLVTEVNLNRLHPGDLVYFSQKQRPQDTGYLLRVFSWVDGYQLVKAIKLVRTNQPLQRTSFPFGGIKSDGRGGIIKLGEPLTILYADGRRHHRLDRVETLILNGVRLG